MIGRAAESQTIPNHPAHLAGAPVVSGEASAVTSDVPPPLLVDLYELTMAQSYLVEGMAAPATFSLFTRHLPEDWGWFLAAGLDNVLTYLERFAFGPEDLEYLEMTSLFTPEFLKYLRSLRFTGTVRAVPEGTVCFPHEPLLDAFGVGSRLGVAAAAPHLDMAYKLVAYRGRPVLKLSAGKATWPAPKQVWRKTSRDGEVEDTISLATEPGPTGARPLLTVAMRDGERQVAELLAAIRERACREVAALPAAYRALRNPGGATGRFSESLIRLRDQCAAEVADAAPATQPEGGSDHAG